MTIIQAVTTIAPITAKFMNRPLIVTINQSYLTDDSALNEKLLGVLKKAFCKPPIPVELIFKSEKLDSSKAFNIPPQEASESALLSEYIDSPLGMILTEFQQLDSSLNASVLLGKFQKIEERIFDEFAQFDDAYKV